MAKDLEIAAMKKDLGQMKAMEERWGPPSVLFFVRSLHSFGSWRGLTPGHTLVILCCSARRFQQEMTKNAGLINNLNMEQERLLEMLSKVKETNFKRVPFHSHHTTVLIPRD